MGSGIAHVAARSGFRVVLHDIQPDILDHALSVISGNLDREVAKNKISGTEKGTAIANIHRTTQYAELHRVDFVIEAVSEDFDTKSKTLKQLEEIIFIHTPLATNTSSLSITRLASDTKHPDRVIGMHFMNPAPVIELVEIVRGMATSDATCRQAKALAESLGKTPVEVQDYPGFVSNRLLMPMINEAIYCLMEGVGSTESIDTVVRLGMSHRMGPLELADLIGLDVCLAIMETLHGGLGDSKYRPCPLLRRMVHAGHLGRKTGRGFYNYVS